MHPLDIFTARTQARVTYSLLSGFIALMLLLLVLACLPLHVDEKLLSILDRIVTAMLPIVGGAIQFWTARHRAEGGDSGPPVASTPPDPIPPTPAAH